MKCEDCRAWIEEYVDCEVDEQDRSRMDSHLSACVSCNAAYRELVSEQRFLLDNYQHEVSVSDNAWANVWAGYLPPPATLWGRLSKAPLFGLNFAGLQPAFKLVSILIVLIGGAYFISRISSTPSQNATDITSKENVAATRNANEASPASSGRDNGHEQQGSRAAAIQPASTLTAPGAMQDSTATASSSGMRYARHARPESVGRRKAGDHSRTGPEGFVARTDGEGETSLVSKPPDDKTVATREPVNPSTSPVNVRASGHIEKVQLVLRSFRNQSVAGGDDELDVSYANQLSKRLLHANNTLRQEMKDRGDLRSEAVLSSVEPFLSEIAALPDRVSRADARRIEERLRQEGVVSALPVFATASLAGGSGVSNR